MVATSYINDEILCTL